MQCQSCGKETRGIKLNGKIYCTFCGEVVKDETDVLEDAYKQQPQKIKKPPKAKTVEENLSNPVAKIITSQGEEIVEKEEEIKELEAEEEILEEIIKTNKNKPKVQIPKSSKIVKSGRKRADYHGFEPIPGEPDPIAEPELPSPEEMEMESPKDMQLEAETENTTNPTGEEDDSYTTNFPLHSKEEKSKITESGQEQALLSEYFKTSAKHLSKKTKAKKVKKPLKRGTKWTLIILTGVVIAGISLFGLSYYVNNFATNPEIIREDVFSGTSLNVNEPAYITPGYEISYLSSSTAESLNLVYTKINNPADKIVIKAEAAFGDIDIYEDYIEEAGTSYQNFRVNGIETWLAESNQAYFVSNGIIYQIEAPNLSEAEIIKIISGIAGS